MAEIVHAVEIAYEGTPLDRFVRFAGTPYAALLDSAKVMDRFGRYSFLAVDPFSVLEAKDGRVTLDGRSFAGDPFAVMAERLAAFPMTHSDGLPPFQTGAVGFLSYDLCHHLERLPRPREDDMRFADLALGFYDVIAAWNHRERRAFVERRYGELIRGLYSDDATVRVAADVQYQDGRQARIRTDVKVYSLELEQRELEPVR